MGVNPSQAKTYSQKLTKIKLHFLKNNWGKVLFCIYIFCTFASSMKIKICAPTREIFLAYGEVKILS